MNSPMKPIVTLTLNPSIDGASEAEEVRPIHKIRTSNERYDPGGGGINVARVVAELGGPSCAVYMAGGVTGPVLDALLKRVGLAKKRVDIADHTRISHVVFENKTGKEYRFTPEGPEIREAEWRGCLETIAEHEFDFLVASGSLPRGVPEDFYVQAGRIARQKGARLVLDTSGPALRIALDAGGVHLVKPSQGEFEQLVGRKLEGHAAIEKAAKAFVDAGKVDIVAVTLGHEGAVLAHKEGVLRLPALPVKPRSAVGAGDSFVAAMTLKLAQGAPVPEAFMYGVAAGTAAVLTPGTALCERLEVERLFGEVKALDRR
jgi:6-phosphofructokinase 2